MTPPPDRDQRNDDNGDQGKVTPAETAGEGGPLDENQLLDLLRQKGPSEPETVLAVVRQHFLSIQQHEHHYPNEIEGMVAAAEDMEHVAPGEGTRFLRALNTDFETQTRMQETEQRTQHRLAYLGFFGGLAIAAGLVAGAIYCATIDQPWVAAMLVGAAAVSMIPSFLRIGDRNRPE